MNDEKKIYTYANFLFIKILFNSNDNWINIY